MRDYGKVFSRIWESADFRALTEDGRVLTLYLLTCQHGTIAGVFRVPDGYACEDLQWSSERVSQGFADVLAKGFATRCEATKWVWVTKYLQWNPPENPNQRKAAAKVAESVPDVCSWKREFLLACGPSFGMEVEPEKKTTAKRSAKGSATVVKPGTGTGTGTGAGTGAGAGAGAGDTAPEARELFLSDLVAEGIDPGIAETWLKVRAKKKAPLTALAWDGVKREAAIAGMTPAQAVLTAAESNWQGFKASWITKAGAPVASRQDALEARNAATVQRLLEEADATE